MTLKLSANAPRWATEYQNCWYYKNGHGEQWVATILKDRLVISGQDIGWKEIALSGEQALMEKKRLEAFIQNPDQTNNELIGVIGQTRSEIAATASDNETLFIEELEHTINAISAKFPLFNLIINEGERLWLLSIISAALPRLNVND